MFRGKNARRSKKFGQIRGKEPVQKEWCRCGHKEQQTYQDCCEGILHGPIEPEVCEINKKYLRFLHYLYFALTESQT